MQYVVKLSVEQPLLDQLLTRTVDLFLGEGMLPLPHPVGSGLVFKNSLKTRNIFFYVYLTENPFCIPFLNCIRVRRFELFCFSFFSLNVKY